MSNQNNTALLAHIDAALPATYGYEKGFRDALESMILALTHVPVPGFLDTAVTTALDAYGNNVAETEIVNGRVLVSVSDGVAEYQCDNGIEVIVFDHDNYGDDPANTEAAPEHYADLAAKAGVPVVQS